MTKKDIHVFWRTLIITVVLSSALSIFPLALVFHPRSSRYIPINFSNEMIPTKSFTAGETTTEATVTMPTSASVSVDASEAANPETYRKEAKKYYPTFQDAIKAYSTSPDVGAHRVSGKVLQVENNDAAIAYYWCLSRDNILGLNSVFSIKKRGEYSNILDYGAFWAEANPAQSSYPISFAYTYTPDEAAAFYLTYQCLSVDVRSLPNNNRPLYLGISDSPAVRNLRILGKPPTRVIESTVKGKTYYIWIYEGLDIRGHLLDAGGFSFGNFNYGQIIDILHIHFVSSSDPLSKKVPIVVVN